MFDMKQLAKLKVLDASAPGAMKAFWAFDKAVFAEGALTTREKQLMAVAVALTTQSAVQARPSSARTRRWQAS